jgi:sarcosine oxidase
MECEISLKGAAMKSYDVAIIGLGTMGSFLAMELARRKVSIVGFDQYVPPHHWGSHSGETRVFREAYYEHPSYTPLAQRSGVLWDALGEDFGKPLLHRIGLLSMGREESPLIRGIRTSAALHQLQILDLTADEIRRHYPALQPPLDFVGLLEKTAGWIDVDASIRESLKRAQALGADLQLDTAIESWQDNGHIAVKTRLKEFSAGRLIITAGASASQLLRSLNLPLVVKRKVLAWFNPAVPDNFRVGALPIFAFERNFFYGFPNIWEQGVKVAEHNGGEVLLSPDLPVDAPTSNDLDPIIQAAQEFLPNLVGPEHPSGQVLRAQTCLYTMTPDEDFIIDRHPRIKNVFFAAGFSGHGFKFAPVVAEALADLALEGKTTLPIDFLRLEGRFSKHP